MYILDLNEPEDAVSPGGTFIKCSTASWSDLKHAYKQAGHVDIAIANVGVSEKQEYFEDQFDGSGELIESKVNVLDVSFRGVLMFIKLAVSYMRCQNSPGSVAGTKPACLQCYKARGTCSWHGLEDIVVLNISTV